MITWAKNKKQVVQSLVYILIGSTLYSLSLNLFLIDNKIAPGGVSGTATVLNYLFNLPVGVLILVLNIPIFYLAFRKIGLRFVLFSIIGTVALSVMVDVTAYLPTLTSDRLLAAIYGGILGGAGTGILISGGATSGGSDLLSYVLADRFPTMSVGKFLILIDGTVVFFASVAYRDINTALYSTITIFLAGKMVDVFVGGVNYARIAYIITSKPDEITKTLFETLKRGVTSLQGTGMYTQSTKTVLMTVIGKDQIPTLKEAVKRTDRDAFVVVTNALEVYGYFDKKRL